MTADALSLLEQYIGAVQACLDSAEGYHDRNNCFERLSAAEAMRLALLNGNIGRAFSILTDEQRSLGWDAIYGEGSDAANAAFHRFAEALKFERLAGLPDAGFGHEKP